MRVYTAHVRCDHHDTEACTAEVTFCVGGPDGAEQAADAAESMAEDYGWDLGFATKCPAHRTTPRPAKVLLLGTMDTSWRTETERAIRAAAGAMGGKTTVEVLSNEDPRWQDPSFALESLTTTGQEPVQVLLGNDLALIRRADVVLWHHGHQGETARIELGLLAGMFPVPYRVVVHVDPWVSWRPYAEALCALRGLRWAPTMDYAAEVAAGLAADVVRLTGPASSPTT